MVDKMGNLTIIISATLSNNRFGKEPGTLALSQFFANQTKLYFGLRTTRLITSLLFDGVATTDSNRCSSWAGGFFINQNETTPDAVNIQGRSITRLYRSPEMRRESSTFPQPEPNSGNESVPLPVQINLTQQNIDNLMASILDKMEALSDLMRQLATLQAQQGNPR